MPHALIRYTLLPEYRDQDSQLLDEVYAELAERKPSDLTYDTYRLDDGLSILVIVGGNADLAILCGLPAFQRYRSTLDTRCVEQPAMAGIEELGTYPTRSDSPAAS